MKVGSPLDATHMEHKHRQLNLEYDTKNKTERYIQLYTNEYTQYQNVSSLNSLEAANSLLEPS